MAPQDDTLALWALTHAPLMRRLPAELKENIFDIFTSISQTITGGQATQTAAAEPSGPRGDPSIPPSNGKSPFLALPQELHRAIFMSSLPNKQRVIKPRCERDRTPARDKSVAPRHNRTSDFMVLCKQIKEQVTTAIYQERTFEIHVHEGVTGGGIEVLDAGRQLLQYLSEDYGIDTRFTRFGDGGEFGFDRLKKINIVIYPKTNNREERHTAMNTYFMNLALAHMLERASVKNVDRIVSLNISFDNTPRARPAQSTQQTQQGRLNIMRNEIHWWDPSLDQPLSSEVHGMSDIELILRPFSILRKVHNVDVQLPPKVRADVNVQGFVNDLKTVMTSTSNTREFRQDDSFEYQANAIKQDLFNSNFGSLFGRNGDQIGDLTEMEMGGDDDGEGEGEGEGDGSHKHNLSSAEDGLELEAKRMRKELQSFLGFGHDVDDADDVDDSGITPWSMQEQPMPGGSFFALAQAHADAVPSLRARTYLVPPTPVAPPGTSEDRTTQPASGRFSINLDSDATTPHFSAPPARPAPPPLRMSASDPTHLAPASSNNATGIVSRIRTAAATFRQRSSTRRTAPVFFPTNCAVCGAQFTDAAAAAAHAKPCRPLPGLGNY
ncbi:hypothetical protein PRZ48_004464 [Zasmidium cellare]|uniref:Uncharacterized protein n=1 Tax=Zasmidium cellare TaxID=395010 RepID=A0ABR0EQ97_ZASCE|nr:hypothetical protein PRZ48_004464 [Zasmidium cellare]